MPSSTMGGRTLKWSIVVVVILLLIAVSARSGSAQQAATPKLTLEDRLEIQEVYAAYTRYFDYADLNDKERMELVKKVWTSDGMFVNLSTPPASGQCPVVKADAPIGQWKTASHDLIKGTLADKLGVKVCVGEVHGYEELSWRAWNIHNRDGNNWRTMFRLGYVEPIPGGARATVAVNQFAWDPSGGKWAGSGTYQDDLVKTPAGWRIKKRVWTADNIVGRWRPAGAPPVTQQ